MLEETIEKLKTTDIPYRQIERDTGITTRWMYMLLSGDIKDPGYSRVSRLHAYLVEHDGDRAA